MAGFPARVGRVFVFEVFGVARLGESGAKFVRAGAVDLGEESLAVAEVAVDAHGGAAAASTRRRTDKSPTPSRPIRSRPPRTSCSAIVGADMGGSIFGNGSALPGTVALTATSRQHNNCYCDNKRYFPLEAPMSVPLARLELRLAAVAGWLCAAILLVNTAKRAALLPTTPVTQLLAPLGQIFAIGLVLGLYVACRRSRGGLLTVGLIANLTAIATLVGVEFVINLVFAYLEPAQVAELRAGPLGIALTVTSLLFIAATVVYTAGLWQGGAPRIPVVLWAVAVFPIGLRALVPELALQIALVVLAVAVVWLAVDLWRRAAEPVAVPA